MVDNAAAALENSLCIPCYTGMHFPLSDSVSRLTFLCLNVMLYACSVLLNFSQILGRVLRFIKKYLKIVCVKDMGAGLH